MDNFWLPNRTANSLSSNPKRKYSTAIVTPNVVNNSSRKICHTYKEANVDRHKRQGETHKTAKCDVKEIWGWEA